MLLCQLITLYKFLVTKNLPYSTADLSVSVFLAVTEFSVIVVLVIFLPSRKLYYQQYLNTLLKYERRLLQTRRKSTQETLVALLKQGICLLIMFYRLLIENLIFI